MASSGKNKAIVIHNPEVVPEICDSIEDYFTAHFSITLSRDRCQDLQTYISQAIYQRNFANSVRISVAVPPKNPTEDEKKILERTKIKLVKTTARTTLLSIRIAKNKFYKM